MLSCPSRPTSPILGNLTTASRDYEQFSIPITICWHCFCELLTTRRRGLPAWWLCLHPTKDTPRLEPHSEVTWPPPRSSPAPCPASESLPHTLGPWAGCLGPCLPKGLGCHHRQVGPRAGVGGRGRQALVWPLLHGPPLQTPRHQTHNFQTTGTLLIRPACRPPPAAQNVTLRARVPVCSQGHRQVSSTCLLGRGRAHPEEEAPVCRLVKKTNAFGLPLTCRQDITDVLEALPRPWPHTALGVPRSPTPLLPPGPPHWPMPGFGARETPGPG